MSHFPCLVLLLCFSVAVPCPVYAAIPAKPNVLLVLVDDQGYGDLSVHGNPVLKTPQMDRLHSESLRFTDFHVAPMCTPTRGQLMTGVDALRNGAMNVSSGRTNLRRDFPTMPEIFAAGGYRTGMFGKWHLGDNYPYRPQDRGFQESIWYQSSSIPSAAGYFNNDYFDDVYQHNGSPKKYEGYTTDVFFREAQKWMKQQAERHEPFFCYLPLAAAHGPFFVPDRYREPYRQQPHRVASFFGMIANIDENLGRLDAFLRENGLHENTILIFMTDNGTATGDPVFNAGMRDKKIALYDGGHRVPFFIRWPAGKLRAAGDVAALTQVQDVLPTLLELCGVAKPAAARFDGTSLAGLLHDPAATLPDRKLTIQFSRMNDSRPKPGDAVVLWKRWRLVADQELYDLATDPAQESNVITQFPDVAAALRDHYATWWAGVEPRLLEISPIHLGSASANPVQLSPCDWVDVFFDQQNQVRGTKKNGAWSLFIEHAGEYEISLRRWPIEADAPITAAMPAFKGVDGGFAAGDAFPVASADLKIGAGTATASRHGRGQVGELPRNLVPRPSRPADVVSRLRRPGNRGRILRLRSSAAPRKMMRSGERRRNRSRLPAPPAHSEIDFGPNRRPTFRASRYHRHQPYERRDAAPLPRHAECPGAFPNVASDAIPPLTRSRLRRPISTAISNLRMANWSLRSRQNPTTHLP